MDKETLATLEKSEPRSRLQRDLKGLEPHKKSRWWVWPLILAVLCFGGYELYQSVNKQKAAASASKTGKARVRNVPVVAVPARRGDMPVYLSGLGSVSAFNTVTVKSRVDGQLIKVLYTEGQYVREGDLLAEIDPRPYQVQLLQAQAQLARDQAQFKDAQVNQERYRQLWEAKVIPRQQFDTQVATVGQFEGGIKADQAAIESAQLNLSYAKVTAPISGRIGLRLVDQGNMIHASDATGIAVIAQLQPIAVLFTIPEDNLQPVLKKLRAGIKLSVIAFDRDFKTKLASGWLLTLDNTIDQSTGTSRLKAEFDNQNGALFPNQFVNVRMLVDTKHNAVIIPAAAVQRGPQGTFTYVVDQNQKASVRPITLGVTEGNDVSVDKGLEAGELVVVDGADKLVDGSKVDVRTPGKDGAPGGRGRRPPGKAQASAE